MMMNRLQWKINNFKSDWKKFWCKHEWVVSKFQVISSVDLDYECKKCGKSR